MGKFNSIKPFLNNSIMIGVTHNHFKSKKLIVDTCSKINFDFILLELNQTNYNFIIKNNVFISEFYDLITKGLGSTTQFANKIKLIDFEISKEITIYDKIKQEFKSKREERFFTKRDSFNFHNNYLFFKLHDSFFSYLNEFVYDKVYTLQKLTNTFFYEVHYRKREEHFLQEIKKYENNRNKILAVVGQYHFEQMENKLPSEFASNFYLHRNSHSNF